MILNHKSAIELLVDSASAIGFNRYTILNLQSTLSENLLPNPSDEGRIRQHQVEIGKSVFHPISGDALLKELLDLLLSKAAVINDPFELPFSDVNKRTSRLAVNISLIQANLVPLTFLDVAEEAYSRARLAVYEMNRVELLRDLYVWAYERSTMQYVALKQQLAEPDKMRLKHRKLIKEIVYEVVTQPPQQAEKIIKTELAKANDLQKEDITDLNALIIEELRRIHEGVLVRYGLRPSQ